MPAPLFCTPQVQEAYNRDVGAARSRISGLEGELAAQRASNAELERQLSARLSQVSAQLTQVWGGAGGGVHSGDIGRAGAIWAGMQKAGA